VNATSVSMSAGVARRMFDRTGIGLGTLCCG
jgi:hypothetical protein